MSYIKVINKSLIRKIAAGEVVERPESIIKELVENSIDAKSSKIEIIIERGGIDSIIVKDDGIGINKDEIELAFKRHTSSKISTIDDLEKIQTLGFRGEALSSIATVSHVSISTSSDGIESFNTEFVDGEILKISSSARERGTTIIIKKIFDSFPARKKFLKSPDTEKTRITKLLKKFFLAYPEIEFIYSTSSKNIYTLKAKEITKRIVDIFGSNYQNKLLPIAIKKGKYNIFGYIGNLDLIKKKSGDQFLFVNKRPIQSKMIQNTVLRSFSSLLQRGEYPFSLINLHTDPELYDINIHPSKKEILFKEEWKVNLLIKDAIKSSLLNISSSLPNFTLNPYQEKVELTETLPYENNQLSHMTIDMIISPSSDKKINDKIENILAQENDKIEIDDLWQIDNKYILTRLKDGVIIIDQHVAHERILYDSAIRGLQESAAESQTVLFPKTVELSADDYDILIMLFPYVNKIGFKLREFGDNTIIIEGVPVYMKNNDEISIINDIISQYGDYGRDELEIHDKISANYACKAAIKAGDALKRNEMKHLVNKLFQSDNPYFCPHGRPIIVNLSTEDLDKRFERY